jgi:hypothetical protein
MKTLRLVLVTGFAVTVLQSCVVVDDNRKDFDRSAYCGREHRLRVVDLDMSPDPVGEGQRIRAWHVRLRADTSGECRTVIRIRESDGSELVGREIAYRLRPGINEIEVEPLERYRFSRDEQCFDVIADIERTGRRVDTERTFCARRISGRRWTMR